MLYPCFPSWKLGWHWQFSSLQEFHLDLWARSIPFELLSTKVMRVKGVIMSLALHYWMGDVHHCSGPRLRNDLYCVEWDVKLYHTIPYHTFRKCFPSLRPLALPPPLKPFLNMPLCCCAFLGRLCGSACVRLTAHPQWLVLGVLHCHIHWHIQLISIFFSRLGYISFWTLGHTSCFCTSRSYTLHSVWSYLWSYLHVLLLTRGAGWRIIVSFLNWIFH